MEGVNQSGDWRYEQPAERVGKIGPEWKWKPELKSAMAEFKKQQWGRSEGSA